MSGIHERGGEGQRVGLCRTCRHARQVPTARALYWLCGLAATDPGFTKYPRLPVLECAGYQPGERPRDASGP
jgi:hypothetical protein